jgi:WhiB family redox-sensing transcriptional regulator
MTARPGLQWSDGAAGPVLNRVQMEGPACRPEDDHLFFGVTIAEINGAKAICARCPVRAGCLRIALADPSLEGVWGGTTGGERAVIRGTLPPPPPKPARKPARPARWSGTLAERHERARAVLEAGEKPCGGACGEVKPLETGFSRMTRALDGYQNWCKACQKANEARRRGEPAGRLPVAA